MDTVINLAQAEDAELFSRTASGDVSAFNVLMRKYNQKLYRTARGILHNEADAEDVVQEAWFKAFTHIRDFRGESRPSTWLTRVVVNEALMRLRRNKSHDLRIQWLETEEQISEAMSDDLLPIASPEQPDQTAWRGEMRRAIEQQIDALPEKYRAVFMLRGVEEMSSAEVAAALDIPEATVRVHYMRARKLLQSGLQASVDAQLGQAFSFAGERCDRIVAGVHQRLRAAGVVFTS
ncbi:RNA polymerase sigma factor [Castellaniella sp. FW104-16D08]|uniref:RNA polymerase sigma factor n=1 Tax=unclassified Castellaniella TaxID=2617606 RepID=UPI003314718E